MQQLLMLLALRKCLCLATLVGQELDATLAKTEAKAEAYEEKHSQAMRTVSTLRGAVWEMFNRIG
jgi:hypothetical protein